MVYARSDEPNKYEPIYTDPCGLDKTVFKVLPEFRIHWQLSPEPSDYHDERWLYETIQLFYSKYVYHRDPRIAFVVASFVLATYRKGDWRAVPYLEYVGPKGSGKTTALETLNEVCYRMYYSDSLTLSSVASMMDRYGCVIGWDEAQTLNQEERIEILAIYKGGYRRGAKRMKAVQSGRGDWQEHSYNTFSFKLLAVENLIDELEGRCLVFNMAKKTKELPKTLTDDFYAEGWKLRGCLLQYRFRNLGRSIPAEIETELNRRVKNDRIRELGFPLLAVTPKEYREKVISFLVDMESRQVATEASGDEADAVRAIVNLVESKSEKDALPDHVKLGFQEYRDELMKVKEITDAKYLPPYKVRKVLDRLGFQKARMSDGKRAFVYDRALMEELSKRFIPSQEDTPETPSDSSGSSGPSQEIIRSLTDKTDLTTSKPYLEDPDGQDLAIVKLAVKEIQDRQGYAPPETLRYIVRERSMGRIDSERLNTLLSQLLDKGDVQRHGAVGWRLP